MGPFRSGPKGLNDGVCQYKTLGMRDSIRAQRGRALFYRVCFKNLGYVSHLTWTIPTSENFINLSLRLLS